MLTSPLFAYCVLGADGIEPPLARNALQLVDAALLERDSRARDEVLHRAGDEDLSRPRFGRHARPDVDCDPAGLVAVELALARMDPGAHLEAELADGTPHRAGTADRARGAVEAREDAVARGVDLLSSEACDLASDDDVVTLEEVAPREVA